MASKKTPEDAELPISRLTYAIGDIHGRSDLLEPLLRFIESDAKRRGREPRVIFLGDIVDRGPDSKGCIELVISALERWPQSKLLLGNHDDWFLKVLGTNHPDSSVVAAWGRNGGISTLLGYHYEPDLCMARNAIALDYEHHISLFQQASIIEVDGPFAFVHAGIDPNVPIHDQSRDDCLWIRKPFLEHTGPLSHVVVHGHTITKSRRPTVTKSRIAIDTGAYATGHLTTLIVDPLTDSIEFAWTVQAGTDVAIEFVRPDRSGTPRALAAHFDS